MPIETIKKGAEWIVLNLVNGLYLVKDWLLLNVGVGSGATAISDNGDNLNLMDSWVTIGIGISLIAFNVVRIIKWILDIKDRNKNIKNGKH